MLAKVKCYICSQTKGLCSLFDGDGAWLCSTMYLRQILVRQFLNLVWGAISSMDYWLSLVALKKKGIILLLWIRQKHSNISIYLLTVQIVFMYWKYVNCLSICQQQYKLCCFSDRTGHKWSLLAIHNVHRLLAVPFVEKCMLPLCDNFTDLFMKRFRVWKVTGTPTGILGSPFVVCQPFQCKI